MALITALILLMLGKSITCFPEDLSGKMLTFAKETKSAQVTVSTPNLQLGALTVCLRFFTDLTRDYGLFSAATTKGSNILNFVVNSPSRNDFQLAVGGDYIYFHDQNVELNAWQSVCGTWKAHTGLAQFWLNGKPSIRRSTTTSNLNGAFTITLGQEPSSWYNRKKSFVGMMSDLHMWDYVLSPLQIQTYSENGTVPEGNVLNWASLDSKITGEVFIENIF